MRSRFTWMLFVLLFTPVLLQAQDDATRPLVVPLRDGGFVAFKSESARTEKKQTTGFMPILEGKLRARALVDDNQVIHRVLQNPKGEYIFGYDLIVLAHADSRKFTITVKPLAAEIEKKLGGGVISTLRDGATPQVIDDGDSFSLDLLVNQIMGVKIVDFVKVSFERSKLWNEKAAPLPRDFTPDAVALRFVNFKISIDGNPVITNKRGANFAGALLWCYVEGHGRFILSLVPREGYPFEKSGVINDNKIAFRMNGREYEWFSTEPILPGGGTWNIWVLHDPKYVPFGGREARKKEEPGKLEKLDKAIQSLPRVIDPSTVTYKSNSNRHNDPNEARGFKVMAGAADRIENLWPRSP